MNEISNPISQTVEQIKFEVASLTRMFNDLKILDHSGHVSARLPDGNFLMQGVNASRALLNPEDLFTMSFQGEILDGPQGTRPASEFHIHSEIYKARPDVNAVLHAHPQVPILFTIAVGAQLKWSKIMDIVGELECQHILTPHIFLLLLLAETW